jgi:hypothetical protein
LWWQCRTFLKKRLKVRELSNRGLTNNIKIFKYIFLSNFYIIYLDHCHWNNETQKFSFEKYLNIYFWVISI